MLSFTEYRPLIWKTAFLSKIRFELLLLFNTVILNRYRRRREERWHLYYPNNPSLKCPDVMFCTCDFDAPALGEKPLNDKRLHYQLYQWMCPGPHQRCRHRLLFCSMSYLLIYSSTLPLPFITSLLISPIKINPHLKISTLVLQRGCCCEGDGLSWFSSFCFSHGFKCSAINLWKDLQKKKRISSLLV